MKYTRSIPSWLLIFCIYFTCLGRLCGCFSVDTTTSTAADTVRIQATTLFPQVTPLQAKQAWLSYQWKQGGGLPVVVSTFNDETKRTLVPIGMEEALVTTNTDNKDTSPPTDATSIQYRVTDFGFLFQNDLVPNSHFATVEFVSTDDDDNDAATSMIWTVEFEALHRAKFYEQFTRFNIETVSANLASYLAIPQTYRRTTLLATTSITNLAESWVNFVWRNGGGLPVPPPLRLDDERRMIVPPFLIERLINVDESLIEYTVANPGLFTYQVHFHLGRVRFEQVSTDQVEMTWEVQIRPFRYSSWLVKPFTAAIITTLARNFKVHVEQPNAVVKISPPRGKGESFASIPKDSWLGGVLDAHLHDKRSTMEQTIAIFKPWTWGRSTDDEGEGAEWTTG